MYTFPGNFLRGRKYGNPPCFRKGRKRPAFDLLAGRCWPCGGGGQSRNPLSVGIAWHSDRFGETQWLESQQSGRMDRI